MKTNVDIVFQLRRSEQEADLRPITPSKIPVGAWRAEEEKAINRALNGSCDSNRNVLEFIPQKIKFYGGLNGLL